MPPKAADHALALEASLNIWAIIGAATWFTPLFLLACAAWAAALLPLTSLLGTSAGGSNAATVAAYLFFWWVAV